MSRAVSRSQHNRRAYGGGPGTWGALREALNDDEEYVSVHVSGEYHLPRESSSSTRRQPK